MIAKQIPVEVDAGRIDALFADLDQSSGPGAVVGIAIGGQPVYRKGFGLASVELPTLLSPTIRMRIGSTTKHFTALAFMLLCEEGRAQIDDPLGKYLPELHPVTHTVTMRQLMTNTSGLREANDIAAQFSTAHAQLITTDHLLRFYRDIDDLSAPCGTTWIYNNGNWVLLSAVIERITGQTLEQMLRERIFEPVGMHDTLVRRWDYQKVSNSASTHKKNAAGVYEWTEYCGGVDYAGAGAMVSTLDDMLRWLAHMGAPVVGTASTWAAMKAPHTLPNGTSTGYGFGLAIGSYRGVEIVHHGGGGNGSNVQMLRVPAAGLDVMVMLNSVDSYAINRTYDILDTCLAGLAPVQDSSGFATGSFRSPTTGRFIRLNAIDKRQVEMIGRSIKESAVDKQQIAMIDAIELPFALERDGVLRTTGTAVYLNKAITLIGDPREPASIRFSDYGNQDELVRIPPAERSDVAAIAGRYRWDETDTEFTIRLTDQGPWMFAVGRFGSNEYRLECLAEGIWWATSQGETAPPWATLSFEADGSAFRFTNACNWNLRFRRVD